MQARAQAARCSIVCKDLPQTGRSPNGGGGGDGDGDDGGGGGGDGGWTAAAAQEAKHHVINLSTGLCKARPLRIFVLSIYFHTEERKLENRTFLFSGTGA